MLLLVSVTNLQEAEEAYIGGADILDLKNPSEGSLGAPHPSIVNEIYSCYKNKIPISTALGDFPNLPGTAALAAVGAASCGTDYIKIGLYGAKTSERAIAVLESVKKALNNNGLKFKQSDIKLIAAAYADYKRLSTLNPLLLPHIAHKTGAEGCMIDTYDKDKKNLFDYLSMEQLEEFIAACHKYRLISALAGSLKVENLDLLAKLNPDIIGVRGAVCTNDNRQAKLAGSRVLSFKNALERVKTADNESVFI